MRDNIQSGSHNKSIHNIESFQTFRHYIMYICTVWGKAFSHMMSSLQHISKSGTNFLLCVDYSSKCTLTSQTISQIYYIYLGVVFLSLHETGKIYCIFYTLTTSHFLVGSEQESGSMITAVMPATELLFFKVPSTSCKET